MWKSQAQICALAISLAIDPTTLPARSDRQSFQVHIATRASVQAPPLAASALLPVGSDRLVFPEQNWNVASNSQTGATVRLVADHNFQNLEQPRIGRDARFDLHVISQSHSGNWKVTRSMASTSQQAADGSASVEAQSSQPGSAAIGLTVTLEQGDSLITPAGSYELTITGTITAN